MLVLPPTCLDKEECSADAVFVPGVMVHKDCRMLEAPVGKHSLQLRILDCSWSTLTHSPGSYRSDFPLVAFYSPWFICHFSIHTNCVPRRLAFGECPRNDVHHSQKLKFLKWHVSKTMVPANEFSDRDRSWIALVLLRHIVDSLWYLGVEALLIPIFGGCEAPRYRRYDVWAAAVPVAAVGSINSLVRVVPVAVPVPVAVVVAVDPVVVVVIGSFELVISNSLCTILRRGSVWI